MISDSTYFLMMNGALTATSSLSKNTPALVMNGGALGIPVSLPTNTILINGNTAVNAVVNLPVTNIFSTNPTNFTAEPERPYVCEGFIINYNAKYTRQELINIFIF